MQVIEALDTFEAGLANTDHSDQAILRDQMLNRLGPPIGHQTLRAAIEGDFFTPLSASRGWSAVLLDAFVDAQVERLQPVEGALEVVEALGEDALERAFAARMALADKFHTNPADFNCVVDQRPRRPGRLAVMATSRAGIFKGSWDEIFAPDSRADYVVDFEGRRIDTRRGMDFELYRAMIATERARNPSRRVLHDTRDRVHRRWSNTWMTGATKRDTRHDEAPVAYMLDGRPVQDGRPKNVGVIRGWVRPVIPLRAA